MFLMRQVENAHPHGMDISESIVGKALAEKASLERHLLKCIIGKTVAEKALMERHLPKCIIGKTLAELHC